MKFPLISIVVGAIFLSGCSFFPPSWIVDRPATGFGSVGRVQAFDAELEEQGDEPVYVTVRLMEPLSIEQLSQLMIQENSPTMTFFVPDIQGPEIGITGGNMPFYGEITYENIRRAITANWAYGAEDLNQKIDANIAQGGKISVETFTADGIASDIQEWWHENFDKISEVIIKPTTREGVITQTTEDGKILLTDWVSGYQFTFPSDWFLSDYSTVATDSRRIRISAPSDDVHKFLVVMKNGQNLEFLRSSLLVPRDSNVETSIQFAGHSAYKYDDASGISHTILIPIPGKDYQVNLYSENLDDADIQEILASFKILE